MREEYINELKDEGVKFFKYFRSASWPERLAILTFVGIVFVVGAIIF